MTQELAKTVRVARARRLPPVHYACALRTAFSTKSRKAEVAKRKEERVPADLLVKVEGGQGRVRNVSASGIYFLTDVPLTDGQPVDLKLEFRDFPSGPLEVTCIGRVVRVEQQGAEIGVAAAISSFEFRRMDTKLGGAD